MGRKKKSARRPNDARGYARGGPTPRPSKGPPSSSASATAATSSKAASVSAAAHDGMRDLLGRLDADAASDKGTAPAKAPSASRPSDRFASKLTHLVYRLDELGFDPGQIERAAAALGYDLALEAALDWLCLNLTPLELPALFTDGEVRRDAGEVATAESLEVVREDANAADDGASRSRNVLAVVEPTTRNDGEGTNESGNSEDEATKRREEEEQKQQLLRRYEYERDDDDDGDVHVEAPPEKSQEEESAAQSDSTPDERRLAEEERSLAELEADLGDDANNYLRSKAEIRQLASRVRVARQKVKGLRRKVERGRAEEERRRRRREEEEAKEEAAEGVGDVPKKEEEADDEERGGEFFDIFAKDDDDKEKEKPEGEAPEPASTEGKAPAAEPAKLLDFTIPKSWTGSTPQQMLEGHLKKHRLPRARYGKLPANGGVSLAVTVERDPPAVRRWEARSANFVRGSSLRDYLATRALYEINPTVQLHRVFPRPFRELWLSWANEKKDEEDRARKVRDDARKERMDRLMSIIAAVQIGDGSDGAGAGANTDAGDGGKEDELDDKQEEAVLDNWDDEEVDDLPVKSKNATCSEMGKKLQTEFSRRQSTPNYRKMKSVRDDLPMAAYRSAVLEAVANHPVTILCAETGAGKSTQCAQYILERALLDGRGDATNVICTQPRRVAATSLAERVSEEMCDGPPGGLVGYQIRMEGRRSARTRLLFCTTGVILRRLRDDPTLEGVTHVICDEVHERAQQVDVLLIVLRRLLQTTRPDLKVILMSATLETELFGSFFRGAPTIRVPGRTFPVSSYHLEDLLDATGHVIEEGSRYAFRENYHSETASLWVTGRGGEKRRETVDLTSQVAPGGVSDRYAGYGMSTRRSMERVNEEVINYDLIEDVLKLVTSQKDGANYFVAPDGADMSEGSILIFLPGLGEIKALMDRLDGSRIFRDRQRFDLVPLHSTLSSRDQRRAFLPPEPGCRKIICATNIAETSVTIPDVVYVIDTGRVREVRRNKKTSTSMLVTDWCPKSSAKQRQGRAGRVQSGICLKLYSSTTAESVMKAVNEPELRRVPLEEICMSILASGFANSCMDFLNQAPQPPSTESVQAAVDVLYDVGAIERITVGHTKQQLERLTPLGFHLSKLPVDVKLGKLLIFGALFRCIDPVLTIAASLSSKSPFSAFVSDAAVAKAKQRVFADPDSDFMTYCNVWDAYESSGSSSRRFCQENYLNHVALREIGDARRQFLDLLCSIGFLDRKVVMENGSRIDPKLLKSCYFNQHAKKTEVINSVICAGLYPNVLRLDQSPSSDHSMWHKGERIYFHGASVNASKKRFTSSENWLVFHEKLGTPNRTSVSTTAFIHPFALLLFGGSVLVKHTERIVVVDDWMNIGTSAQTGVILRELRKKLNVFLQRMIKCADTSEIEKLDSSMIDGIIKILVS